MTMGTCGSLVAFKPRDRNRQLRAFIFPKDCPTRGGALGRGAREGAEEGRGSRRGNKRERVDSFLRFPLAGVALT